MTKGRLGTRGWPALLIALALVAQSGSSQQPPPPPPQSQRATIRVTNELVLVNVTVRDRQGNPVRDLKREDFTVLEDNKPQQILNIDIENTDVVPPAEVEQAHVLGTGRLESPRPAAASDVPETFKDRRLIILFFDLSAMQPDEIDRSTQAAGNYVDRQMAPADLAAVISLGSTLTVNQDFTQDKKLLKKALDSLNPTSGPGFEEGSTGTTEGTPDTAQPFTADDTEYNIFNTDRRLQALRSLAAQLAGVNQKKSLIYFSSGMSRTGIENQTELRAAINAAVQSNVAIYMLDIRGLQALVPGGEAQNASLRGVAPYSGKATLNALNSNFGSQETLVTLAADTGGKAFLDSNDFSQVFRRVQEDTSMYYLLGYHSGNPARDGKFRRIQVKVNRPGVKLEYRRGYYAPADFQHATKDDRERQLEEEVDSDLPSTDLPTYLAAGYFRLAQNRFYVPVSVVVPGSAIPFVRASDQDRATLDVIAVVMDDARRPLGRIRDTVKLAVPGEKDVQRKNVQYNNAFVLPAGKYRLKLVVRENQTGLVGSFETDLTLPDFKSAPLKMSSVVLATQTQPAGKGRGKSLQSPLIRDGVELIPNVTHVFSSSQHLYFFYEVYDPGREAKSGAGKAAGENSKAVRVLSSVEFFRGKVKAYETPLVAVEQLGAPERGAAVFQMEVPLDGLKPGLYTCQVNVIDDAADRFLFPRLALLIRP